MLALVTIPPMPDRDITLLLQSLGKDNGRASSELLSLLYGELRRLAGSRMLFLDIHVPATASDLERIFEQGVCIRLLVGWSRFCASSVQGAVPMKKPTSILEILPVPNTPRLQGT